MTVREDILVELTMDPITKIIGELGQGDLNILEVELSEQATKIKTTEDVVEQGHLYGLHILIVGKAQHDWLIGNDRMGYPS